MPSALRHEDRCQSRFEYSQCLHSSEDRYGFHSAYLSALSDEELDAFLEKAKKVVDKENQGVTSADLDSMAKIKILQKEKELSLKDQIEQRDKALSFMKYKELDYIEKFDIAEQSLKTLTKESIKPSVEIVLDKHQGESSVPEIVNKGDPTM
ncbi:hypothetical protein Q3G72_013712 [Acer saccharum]|nr:hypothetical protein Q3G72_013712 [Acer saccharum]